MVNHPYMFTIGCGILGFFIPEFFKALSRRHIVVPLSMNLCTMVGAGLVAASFVF
jgi:hypothetical protein